MEFAEGSAVQFLSDPHGDGWGLRIHFQDDCLAPVPSDSVLLGLSLPAASHPPGPPCGLGFLQWGSLGRQVYTCVWILRHRKLMAQM